MKRVTATMLEAYRRFTTNEYATYEEMVNTIKGGVEPSPAMLLGTALHSALEWYVSDFVDIGKDGPTKVFEGHTIDIASVAEYHYNWLDYSWFREVSTAKPVTTVPGLFLKCKADAVAGTTVVDHKVTTKAITDATLQRYQDSYQWRAYLHAFGCSQFMYNVLQCEERNGVWYVVNQEVVYCNDYEGMEADVNNMALQLYQWCEQNDLTEYLHKGGDNA